MHIPVLSDCAADAALTAQKNSLALVGSSISGNMQPKARYLCCSLFSSPLKRARTTSEIMWQGRDGPLNYIESLKEAPLGWLEGMTNGKQCCLTVLWTACRSTCSDSHGHLHVAASHIVPVPQCTCHSVFVLCGHAMQKLNVLLQSTTLPPPPP